ncbi:hypothetical protein G7072_17835 [Nocardioides sp. HDW12B]|uniref:hypothetical protein n=1 Tax=Nocardioides sp. HDW12B TaxID=2714939 RepID=UPI001407C9F9|nr:hypothetical protein [Nocardioides sp. HDW12B]QIK67954.1 hypothetical protein G7072_17835 [Nocardioides sp. HDW12B]
MTSLQTVVMGLVIVFLDIPPDGYDWIADPVGWVLVLLGLAPLARRLPNQRGLVVAAWVCLLFSVLSWPAGSPATLTPLLGWLFSLPTLAWCFLVCDAVSDAVTGRLRWVALALRAAFAVVAPLPGLVYLAEQNWLSTPAEVLILVANLALVFVLSSASGRPGLGEPEETSPPPAAPTKRSAARTSPEPPAPAPAPARRASTTGFSAAEAKRKARARRDREAAARSTGAKTLGAKASSAKPTGTKASGATGSGEKRSATPVPTEPSGTGGASSSPADDTPVTGAEVIEKVRRRRQARERSRSGRDEQDSSED